MNNNLNFNTIAIKHVFNEYAKCICFFYISYCVCFLVSNLSRFLKCSTKRLSQFLEE